ncbi:MAG: hypothetical protein V1777_04645, partial [Candidatus Micrarchaeota archaeon]
MFNKKGQGSLEYLLIIGGGILVAVIIIGAIISLAGTGTGSSRQNTANQACSAINNSLNCLAYDNATWSGGNCPTGYTTVGAIDCCWWNS